MHQVMTFLYFCRWGCCECNKVSNGYLH